MQGNPISYSERRLRQVRAAAAVFGRAYEVRYPATREGFRAYWRHARMMRHVSWSVQWKRALPRPVWEGNYKLHWQWGMAGEARMGWVWPDRVWTHTDFPVWHFRYFLANEAAKVMREGGNHLALLDKACRLLLKDPRGRPYAERRA